MNCSKCKAELNTLGIDFRNAGLQQRVTGIYQMITCKKCGRTQKGQKVKDNEYIGE